MFLNKKLLKKLSTINENLPDLKNSILYETNKNIARYQTAMYFNQKAFSEFKGAFSGRDIAVVGTGHAAKNFIPIKNAIYIGMNRSFLLNNIDFDFLFSIDMLGINSFIE